MKIGVILFLITAFGFQTYAAEVCGSSAYAYAVEYCKTQTGTNMFDGPAQCQFSVDYMESHPMADVREGEKACVSTYRFTTMCMRGVYAYLRGKKP